MRERFRRVIAGLLAGGVVGLVATFGAAAPAAADTIAVREIDTTDFPEVRISVLVSGEAPDLGQVQLRENGKILTDFDVVPITKTSKPIGIVLVIDISGSMQANDAIRQAKSAAKRFIEQRGANDVIAIVLVSSGARVFVNFTKDTDLLIDAVDRISAQGETALYDGIATGASLLAARPDLQPNMVVLTDGEDTSSKSTEDQAVGGAVDAKAAVFTVGIETQALQAGPLRRLADATGGQYFPAATPQALTDIYDRVQQSLRNQYEVRYTSAATDPVLEVTVSAPGLQASASAKIGSLSRGSQAQPDVIDPSPAPGFLKGSFGKVLGIALALVAIALVVFVVVLLFVRESTALDTALSPYGDESVGEGEKSLATRGADLIQQAVGLTGRFAERQGILPQVEHMLERANIPLRAAEALFFYIAIVVVGSLLALIISRSIFGLLGGVAILGLLPPAVLNFLSAQRKRRFTRQLPDTLQLLGGSLRAGYSLMQGVEAVAQEVDEPMGRELRRVIVESRLGRPLDEALDDAADRMESPDFSWAVMAIKIQREVGGNLAELLETVSETMIARERLRGEVRALTAEGRISAVILGALPLGLLFMLWAINREYIELLFDETVGKLMLAGGAVLALVGFFWLKKIVEIEI